MHNADCCGVALSTLESYVEKSARGTGKLHRVNENELTKLILDIGYNKDGLLKAKSILENSIRVRKADKANQPDRRLDPGHQKRVDMEQRVLNRINNMLKELE
ncbi:hypothetical protein [Moraxella porci]|uniref:hypothetical protein n=1 Tax=Moraxella porci TaxID=1288392 RepID=UPI00244B42E9|nr:hypothetical protein [Moraxella porci]MDH2274438.1 hypothetical protein [Moraxella porci]